MYTHARIPPADDICEPLPCIHQFDKEALQGGVNRAGTKEQIQAVMDAVLMPLGCAGTKQQIQAVVDAELIPPLVAMLGEAEFDIKKEAAWAISNATSGGRCAPHK